jgi:hypothetical protein
LTVGPSLPLIGMWARQRGAMSVRFGWRGWVVRPVLEAGGWIVVEEWLPAELLDAA